MIDLDKDSFGEKAGWMFYAGASRAKIHLELICCLKEVRGRQKYEDKNCLLQGNEVADEVANLAREYDADAEPHLSREADLYSPYKK